METSEFISADIILADVLPSVNDVELRMGISKGRYLSFIQRGVEELAKDSFFDKRTLDLKLPKVGQIAVNIPTDTFNIRYIYLWNGACCTPSASQKVWWKRNFNNKGNGSGYTADVKDIGGGTWDPFIPMYFPVFETIYYANVMEGKIMFSQSCSGYDMVRIICNGLGGEIGAYPTIPRQFRQAIIDYVRCKVYQEWMAKEPRTYRILYEECEKALNNQVNGSWKKARIFASSMSTFEQNSMAEYYGKINC